MLHRFTGAPGRRFLIEALRAQPIVGGDISLADLVADSCTLETFQKGDHIVEEHGSDNDLYLILTGEVSVLVQGRVVATRSAGQHIGEMALVDPGKRRSATVLAENEVVVARVPAEAAVGLADANPDIWKNIARELGERLRQRNQFVTSVNPRPVLFLGCSAEALPIGRAIQSSLDHDPIVVKLWTNDVFGASQFPIESLEQELTNVDFAALILSPDDTVVSRDTASEAPRDNLVLELGLFMGALGRERTFILCPRGSDVKIPTDLLGITSLRYGNEVGDGLSSTVASATNELRDRILRTGPK